MSLLDPDTAGVLLLRLQAHWPRLGSDELSARDWIRSLRAGGPGAGDAVEVLVTTWTRDRAPGIADWQEVCRQIARRRALEAGEHRALPSGRPDREIAAAGLAAARAALDRVRGGNR